MAFIYNKNQNKFNLLKNYKILLFKEIIPKVYYA